MSKTAQDIPASWRFFKRESIDGHSIVSIYLLRSERCGFHHFHEVVLLPSPDPRARFFRHGTTGLGEVVRYSTFDPRFSSLQLGSRPSVCTRNRPKTDRRTCMNKKRVHNTGAVQSLAVKMGSNTVDINLPAPLCQPAFPLR